MHKIFYLEGIKTTHSTLAYFEFTFTIELTTLSTSLQIGDSLASKEPPLPKHSPNRLPHILQYSIRPTQPFNCISRSLVKGNLNNRLSFTCIFIILVFNFKKMILISESVHSFTHKTTKLGENGHSRHYITINAIVLTHATSFLKVVGELF